MHELKTFRTSGLSSPRACRSPPASPLTCCLRARRSADLVARSASARSGPARSASACKNKLPNTTALRSIDLNQHRSSPRRLAGLPYRYQVKQGQDGRGGGAVGAGRFPICLASCCHGHPDAVEEHRRCRQGQRAFARGSTLSNQPMT